jgi:hypothetical protein
MNIEQLESFNLSDAVKFHDKLNPLLWDNRENLHPEIKEQLLAIAADFGDYIGVDNLNLKDITISGSNAAFSYTPHSDIDLHLIVDLGDEEHKDIFRELFDAKKFIYNTEHKITIKGIPVELYVQDANQAHHSQGVYSILNNAWIEIPKRRHADIDDMSVRSKYKDLSKRIREAIKSKSVEQMNAVMEKIKDIRGAGLASHGEFGAENLAFKLLRNKGDLKKLQNARKAAKSAELSLKERIRPPVNYGYGQDYLDEVGLTPDGTNPSTCEFTNEEQLDEVGLTPDGTNPSTSQFTNEGGKTDSDIVNDFAQFCVTNLRLESPIRLRLKKDPAWSERNKTFGRYNHETNELEVSLAGRHLMDVLRTIAHELTHQRQHEREDVPDHAGETGSEYENEANARAGILMREYGHQHPELFTGADLSEGLLSEYISMGSDKNFQEVAPYKNYKIYVRKKPFGNTGMYTAHTEIDRKEFVGKGTSQEEAIQAARDKIDFVLNAQKKVTGSSTIDFNVKFATDLLADPRQTFYAKLENIGGGPKLVIAGLDIAADPELLAAGDFKKSSLRNQVDDEGRSTPLPGIPLSAKSLRAGEWIANGRYTVGNETTDSDGNRIFDLTYHSTAHTKTDKLRLNQPAFTLGTNREISEATGYIPTAAEADDPRFEMALTVDIKPGAIGKNANKLLLNTDSQGHPQELRADGVVQRMMKEYLGFKNEN